MTEPVPQFLESPQVPEQSQSVPAAPAGPPEGEKRYVDNFPEGKSVGEMTDAERALYWQNYARKHEGAAKALNNGVDPVDWAKNLYNGLTPSQVAEIQSKVEAAETAKLSPSEQTIKAAREEAAQQARAETEAQYLPQIQRSSAQGIASSVVSGDKLTAFVNAISPQLPDGRFAPPLAVLGENGQVDESKVMGLLTAMYGADPQPAGPRWQNFGQYAPPPPPANPGSGGAAEAQKRFGVKPKS